MDPQSGVLEMIGQMSKAGSDPHYRKQLRHEAKKHKKEEGKIRVDSMDSDEDVENHKNVVPEVDEPKKVNTASTFAKQSHFMKFSGVVAGLQFAVVILIAQRRLPLAEGSEFVVVLSMLMLTAAHGKIIAFLPDDNSDVIKSTGDALLFLCIGFPLVLYLFVIELWFIVFLFSYDADVQLAAFNNNANRILTIGKVLSILKVTLIGIATIALLSPCKKRHHSSK